MKKMPDTVRSIEIALSLDDAAELYLRELLKSHFLNYPGMTAPELVMIRACDTTAETVFWERIGRLISRNVRSMNGTGPHVLVDAFGETLRVGVRNEGKRLIFHLLEREHIAIPSVLAPELAK